MMKKQQSYQKLGLKRAKNPQDTLGAKALLKAIRGSDVRLDNAGMYQEFCRIQMELCFTKDNFVSNIQLKQLSYALKSKSPCLEIYKEFKKYMERNAYPPEYMQEIFWWLTQYRKNILICGRQTYMGDMNDAEQIFVKEIDAFNKAKALGFSEQKGEKND